MMSGSIIGNKNTHVFHMPGDRGALPAAAEPRLLPHRRRRPKPRATTAPAGAGMRWADAP